MKKVRSKKCKICGSEFQTYDSFRKWCCPDCGVKYAQEQLKKQREKAIAKRNREEKLKIKAVKESQKSTGDLTSEAQSAVNRYIRLRDDGKECISCGTPLVSEKLGGGFDAGHYRSRGSSPQLRFYTLNIHGQCKRCNRYLGGNYHQFRLGLIERLGVKKVEQIDVDERPRHYSKEDLKRIKQIFSKKCRLLIKRKGF